MKKSSVMMIAAIMFLSSCGTLSQLASLSDGQMYQDGIYANTPDFRSKEEKVRSRTETEQLVAKTKESQIYLFGDRKDTVMIPENFSATIRYDQPAGNTIVVVGENPYDWRNNINPWYYYDSPYSMSSAWYWSRYNSPYRSRAYWHSGWHGGWHDPWYGGWYDPWYSGWYDPWYYGGYWGLHDPWYYGGFGPYYGWYGGLGYYPGYHPGHHPGHHHGPHWGGHNGPGHGHGGHFGKEKWNGPRHETETDKKAFATDSDRMTARRGMGTTSSKGRGTIDGSKGSSSVNSGKQTTAGKATTTGKTPTYRRPAVSKGNSSVSTRTSTNGSQDRSTVSRSTNSSSSSSYNRTSSGSSYNSSTTSPTRSSSYNTGSSSGYSRSSTGGGYSGGGSRSGGHSGGRR